MAPAESTVERLFLGFTRDVDAARLARIVGAGESFVGALPEDARVEVGQMLSASWRDRSLLRMATPSLARTQIVRRRPDFHPVLDSPAGLAWLGGELDALRALVSAVAH